MENTTPSPAPWKIESFGDYIALFDADNTRLGDLYAAPTVAKDHNAMADARLIKAAPDLFDMVGELMDQMESHAPEVYYRSDTIMRADDLLAAIDGERGESLIQWKTENLQYFVKCGEQAVAAFLTLEDADAYANLHDPDFNTLSVVDACGNMVHE